MNKEGIVIDLMKFTYFPCIYDPKRVDDLYVKVDNKDLIPAAYVFPAENREKVVEQLNELARLKREYDNATANIYYKVLSTLH